MTNRLSRQVLEKELRSKKNKKDYLISRWKNIVSNTEIYSIVNMKDFEETAYFPVLPTLEDNIIQWNVTRTDDTFAKSMWSARLIDDQMIWVTIGNVKL